jgi:hypothetical protein
LNNLRSALDQTGYTTAVLGGKVEPKHALFPIGDDAAGLETGIKGRCKDIPSEIVEVFRSFKAYKGGNDALWALNKLRHSFHTAIIPSNFLPGAIDIGSLKVVTPPVYLFLPPRWDGNKNEVAIARLGPRAELKLKAKFTFSIAFDQIDFMRGIPIFRALRVMAPK